VEHHQLALVVVVKATQALTLYSLQLLHQAAVGVVAILLTSLVAALVALVAVQVTRQQESAVQVTQVDILQ
jgi:hypothetical protein